MIARLANAIRPTPHGARLALVVPVIAVLWCGYQLWRVCSIGEPLHTAAAPRGGISLQLAPSAADAAAIRDEWDRRHLIPVFAQSLEQDSYLIAAYVATLLLTSMWVVWVANLSRIAFGLIVGFAVLTGLCDLAENWLLGVTINHEAHLPVHGIAMWLTSRLDTLLDPVVEWTSALTGMTSRMSTAEYLRTREFVHAVTLARLAAMSKFSFLLFAITGLAVAVGGVLRLTIDFMTDASPEVPRQSLKDLVDLETKRIFATTPQRTEDKPEYTLHEPADEQFVHFRAADVIGLALSGGGIRSATFNLGLLQGMQRIGLLRLFDYLATVSGGGYVGSFWSEWLARQHEINEAAFEMKRTERLAEAGAKRDEILATKPPLLPDKSLFPTTSASETGPSSLIDTDQERHLREFSAFLAPRIGFFEVEMWTAVVALFGGLVPALVIGLAVIGAAILAWLALTFALASSSIWAPASVIALVTAMVFRGFETMWQTFRKESAGRARVGTAEERAVSARAANRYRWFATLTVVLVLVLQLLIPFFYRMRLGSAWPIFSQFVQGGWYPAPDISGIVRWWAVTGIASPGQPWIAQQHPWVFSPRLFDFAIVWFTTGLILLLLRVIFAVSPTRRETQASFDRVVMRVLGLAVFWATLTTIWHVAINLSSIVGAATGALVTGGAFAALRNWIGVALRRPTEATMTDRLKPYLPQVLAYLTIALSAVAVGGLLIEFAGDDWLRWWFAAVVIDIFIVLAFFIQPEEFGLHAFYRDRVSRAYAGACNLALNQLASDNRGTDPKDGDDRYISGLVDRPMHLVCCAANDLSGDQVETLNRGARSAVVSKLGFSMGRHFHPWSDRSDLRLGSAITASAAAFNSNMGQISARVGPAVSFVMTMLNLRLGLWLRHPAARRVEGRRWPGLLLYREMFGLTSASGRIDDSAELTPSLRDVHLSDGGHFENLALYELIRRHCRYVLVSDCGADPTVAFDDLGNALRRIREDFGVDIELDVSSLRRDENGRSAQHVAIGTIHYSQTDRGILLYVKPSMTGDEPTDVQQYMTRNKAFPHEATGDQFYDEAQWESYRRLGLHAADCIFDFVAREDGDRRGADWVFAEASHRWGPTPEGLEDSVLEMTKRFGVLEAELHQRGARDVVSDIIPEIALLPHHLKGLYGHSTPALGQSITGSTEISDVTFLMRVIQLMEDAWLTCQLDQWWTHPLNLGWINLFARWATSPLFRFWWPLLSPMFSPGFCRFIQERFPMRARQKGGRPVPLPPEGQVRRVAGRPYGLATMWWKERSAQPINWEGQDGRIVRTLYEHVIGLPDPTDDSATVKVQVGLIGIIRRGSTIRWTSDDFFVPPSLWGSGLGWYFLKNLLKLMSRGAEWCYVIVKMPPEGSRHHVALDDRHAFLEQYRKIGFREQRSTISAPTPLDRELRMELGFEPEHGDTLLSLDLKQWRQRQG